MPHVVEPHKPGEGDHRAPEGSSWLDSLPLRTLAQQLAFDAVATVAVVANDAVSSSPDGIEWKVLGSLLLKSLVATILSSIMRQVRPPSRPPQP